MVKLEKYLQVDLERNQQIDIDVVYNTSVLIGDVLENQPSLVISYIEVVESSMHLENVNEPPTKEEFIDSDYAFPSSDEDYQHVINE